MSIDKANSVIAKTKQHHRVPLIVKPLPPERLVKIDHYEDLIAIKLAAHNVVRALGKQHSDLLVMQHLEAALNYKHHSVLSGK